jgi:cell division transport system permease protein
MRVDFVMSGVATGLRRNLSMTVALVVTTAISIALVGAALLVRTGIDRFQDNYKNKLAVSIYLKNDITPAQTDTLRTSLQNDDLVKSVSFISIQEAYDLGKRLLDPATAQFVEPGDLPASFTIQLKNQATDYPAIAAKYGKTAGVDQVQNEDDGLKKVLLLFNRVQLAVLAMALFIVIAAVMLMINTVQLAANHRRAETGIMRLVGASQWMVQLPFVLEAMIASLIGGVMAVALTLGGKSLLFDGVFEQQIRQHVLPEIKINDVLIATGGSSLGAILLAGITAYGTLRLAVRL